MNKKPSIFYGVIAATDIRSYSTLIDLLLHSIEPTANNLTYYAIINSKDTQLSSDATINLNSINVASITFSTDKPVTNSDYIKVIPMDISANFKDTDRLFNMSSVLEIILYITNALVDYNKHYFNLDAKYYAKVEDNKVYVYLKK